MSDRTAVGPIGDQEEYLLSLCNNYALDDDLRKMAGILYATVQRLRTLDETIAATTDTVLEQEFYKGSREG